MLRSITFQGRKQFTAEYFATDVKNRSYKGQNDNGYYKGYGKDLDYQLVGDTTFRINSGLFMVQGRQCSVVLGTTEDILVPQQTSNILGYIVARINTNVPTGENITITYKLGDESNYPTLEQQDTYSIGELDSAVYELALYSFTIRTSITNVTKLIRPVSNTQIEVDTLGTGTPTDYLCPGGLFLKKITSGSYTTMLKNADSIEKLSLDADTIQGESLDSLNKKVENLQKSIAGVTPKYYQGFGQVLNSNLQGAIRGQITGELVGNILKVEIKGSVDHNNGTVDNNTGYGVGRILIATLLGLDSSKISYGDDLAKRGKWKSYNLDGTNFAKDQIYGYGSILNWDRNWGYNFAKIFSSLEGVTVYSLNQIAVAPGYIEITAYFYYNE